MVLGATGGSQGLPDGIHVNKRGLRDSGGGLRGYVKFPWHYQRGIRGLWTVEGHLQLQRWHKGLWEVI